MSKNKVLDDECVTFLCKLQREDAQNELFSRFNSECYKISFGILKEFRHTGVDINVLVNSCLNVLNNAAYKFAYDRGNKFLSYFRSSARHEIMDILQCESYKSKKSPTPYLSVSLDEEIPFTDDHEAFSKVIGVCEDEALSANILLREIRRLIFERKIELNERNRLIGLDYLDEVPLEVLMEKYLISWRTLQNALRAIKKAITGYYKKIQY